MPRRRRAMLHNTGDPLNAGDLRALVARLNDVHWPGDLPVEVITPLPPWDRRAVTLRVAAPTEGNNTV